MYKDQKTTEHKRDARGRTIVENDSQRARGRNEKSGFSQFAAVALTTLALALVITGLLLHASVQNNEKSLTRINNLERAALTKTEGGIATPTVSENTNNGAAADASSVQPTLSNDMRNGEVIPTLDEPVQEILPVPSEKILDTKTPMEEAPAPTPAPLPETLPIDPVESIMQETPLPDALEITEDVGFYSDAEIF